MAKRPKQLNVIEAFQHFYKELETKGRIITDPDLYEKSADLSEVTNEDIDRVVNEIFG